ncbi:MAG: alpha/beta hydrolase [Christensenellaceae bacterium]|jgi:acetyl esterase/lipase|nr:alpha/beta hydrolase [Christensenellaceae bacterium]
MSIKITAKELSQKIFLWKNKNRSEIGYDIFHDRNIIGICDIHFDKSLPRYNTLDIYISKQPSQKPTLFYVTTDESSNKNYKRRGLSRRVASLNYNVVSVTCGHTFPQNLHACMSALQWVYDNKDRFSLDLYSLVLAGDSSGAFVSFCIATAITQLDYAHELKVTVPDVKLLAEAYFCGFYDIPALLSSDDFRYEAHSIVKKLLGKKIKHISHFEKFSHLDVLSPFKYFIESRGPIFFSHTDFDNLFSRQGEALMRMIVKLDIPYVEVRAIKAQMNRNWQLDVNNSFGMTTIDAFTDFLSAVRIDKDNFISKYIDI